MKLALHADVHKLKLGHLHTYSGVSPRYNAKRDGKQVTASSGV